MAESHHPRRESPSPCWSILAESSPGQEQRLLAESMAQLLGDLLRAVLQSKSPGSIAGETMLTRYRELAAACGANELPGPASPTLSHASLARRCVSWLKLTLRAPDDLSQSPAVREFLDALTLFPSLFDLDPAARSRRARFTWLLTHDRRLDASTREATTALIEACEHLGLLLWPDAETA